MSVYVSVHIQKDVNSFQLFVSWLNDTFYEIFHFMKSLQLNMGPHLKLFFYIQSVTVINILPKGKNIAVFNLCLFCL